MTNQNTNNFSEFLTNWVVGLHFHRESQPDPLGVDLQSLEDRVLYSASPVPIELVQPVDFAEPNCEDLDCFASIETSLDDLADAFVLHEFLELRSESANDAFASETTLGGGRDDLFNDPANELVIVDTSVEGYQALVDDLMNQRSANGELNQRRFEVVYLSQTNDGVSQVTSILEGRTDVNAIHLVTHGSDGELQLGGSVLNHENLDQFQTQIAAWSESLHVDADFLVYGCNVAESELGQGFIEDLAAILDADVSASTNVTGHASLGGDWYFEFAVGMVEAGAAFSESITVNWTESLGPGAPLVALAQAPGDLDGSQSGNPVVAADYVGSLVILTSTNQVVGADGLDVYATIRSNSGIDLTTDVRVNTATADNQFDAVVAMNDAGDSVVVWTSDAGGQNNIFATIFDSDGSVEVSEFQVNDGGTTAENAAVTMSSDGQIVIAWQGSGAADSDGIYAKRFSAYGDELSDVLAVNGNAFLVQSTPDVDINDLGEFVVAWTDFDGTGGEGELEFSVFDADNQRVVTDQTGLSTAGHYHVSASVAIDDNRNIAYSATSVPNDATDLQQSISGIFVDSVDIDAEVINYDAAWSFTSGDRHQISVHDYDYSSGEQRNSTLTIANNEILIAWVSSGGAPVNEGLFYRSFSLVDGSALSGESSFSVSTNQFEQSSSFVSFHNNEAWAVVWQDEEPATPTVESDWSQTYTNARPTGTDGGATISEDSPYVFSDSDFGYGDTETPLLGQVEIDSVPFSGVLLLGGKLVEPGDEISGDDIRAGKLVYLPATNASSDVLAAANTTFLFTVNDGYSDALTQNSFEFTINAAADETGVALGEVLVPVDGETIVNDNLLGDQTEFDISALQAGGYVVVWEDDSDGVIYQRIYDGAGNRSAVTTIESGQANEQTTP